MSLQQIRVYEPRGKHQGFFSMVKAMFKDLFDSSELGKRLFIRDIKAEYRQSLLGIVWAFVTPLATAITWIFLSASGAVSIEGTSIPYPLFVFIGTIVWSVFADSMTAPLQQTTASAALISKINFPKEAILMSGYYKLAFNSVIKVVILVVVSIVFGYYPGLGFFGFLLSLLLIMAFGYSLGLLLTPVGMLYKDIGRAIPVALPFLMYLAPVVYPGGRISSLRGFIELNPMTPLINSSRDLLTGGSFYNPTYMWIILGGTLLLGFIGWIIYRVSIPIVVERM